MGNKISDIKRQNDFIEKEHVRINLTNEKDTNKKKKEFLEKRKLLQTIKYKT